MKINLFFLFFLLVAGLSAQKDFYRDYSFSEADTLRGMLRPERTCYDVTFYDINIRIDPQKKKIEGVVDIVYRVVADFTVMQIDLYRNMKINTITMEGKPLKYERRYDAVMVQTPPQKKGKTGALRVSYEGMPRVAANPPWDGGFVWAKDRNDKPWVGVACEGDGASLWWPNKDHLSDEPDSASIRVAVPKGLICVANGNLRKREDLGDFERFDWFVSYPINNYNVTVNIADYAHFSDTYTAADGETLDLDYYVLPENLEKAKTHFKQVQPMLACFEQYFGKYPFWNDGFAMVETPYLGMEHQSAIAYGNRYMRGYLGGMIPRDMDWDYIIIHETGHEYFGNSISANDLAEMWIHESFTTYMEALYVECRYDYDAAVRYLVGQRYYIANQQPVLGPKEVNWDHWDSSDHYYKGAWILHTLRHAINNDDLWWKILKGFYRKYQMSNITTEDFVRYVNEATGKDWQIFFSQYLEYPEIPTLEYRLEPVTDGIRLHYRWQADVPGFAMPVLVGKQDAYTMVNPKTGEWQATVLTGLNAKDVKVAKELFLVNAKLVK